MDPDLARAFLGKHHRAVLATSRADGRPQLSPVTCALDSDGRVVISTREGAMKTANVRRLGRAAVFVFQDEFYGEWVQAEGAATVESVPEAMEALVRYYRLVAGEHPDWADYRAAMTRDKRVLIRIRIDRAGPLKAG